MNSKNFREKQIKMVTLFRFLRATLFNRYVWLIILPLSIGWFMLADRLQERTHKAMYDQLDSVKQIWGGNLAQPMPSIRYKRFSSDVSSLSKGETHAMDISVDLTVDYRKKGLIYYTGYNADFTGKYILVNPENEQIYLSFIFPYPTQQGEGMLRNVKLLINGEEDNTNTEYQPALALWTGLLKPAESLEITVNYQGRGLNQFKYGFEPGQQINNFSMKMTVHGAKMLDYADSTMPPTETPQDTPDGKLLIWKLDRTLTQFNIGVVLPDKLNIEKQLAVMTFRAPAFFSLFLVSLFVIFLLAGESLNFIPVAILSVTYFLFYPLFAYLLVYIDLIIAFAIAFIVIGLLIFNYVRSLHNAKIAFAVTTGYIFYLGITSVAALLPTYTGLILTVEGVVLMGIIMQVLSRYKNLQWSELMNKARPLSQPNLSSQPVEPKQDAAS